MTASTGTRTESSRSSQTTSRGGRNAGPAAGRRSAGRGGGGTSTRPVERALASTLDKHTLSVPLPDDIGTLRLPEPQRLAYYGGLAALAVFGILDWPVAIALGIGHVLAEQHRRKFVEDIGEALEEA